MQHVFRTPDGENVDKSEVLILPMIDLDPTDTTCIYSTLLYIQEQASRLNLPTATVTFDQPLWLKAMEIKSAKCLDRIVLRLGGFHLLMSACSSLFHTMKGSGIEEALCETYGQNAVTHMMSGKAIARSLRGLYLIEAALTSTLLAHVLPSSSSSEVESREKDMVVQQIHWGWLPYCEKESSPMVRTVDWSDNRTGPDEVSQKPWRLDKRKGHDWKREAAVGLHNACMCYCTWCHVNTDREAASDERAARGYGESETQSRLERYEKDNGMVCGARPLRWHCSSIAISGQWSDSTWRGWHQLWWHRESRWSDTTEYGW